MCDISKNPILQSNQWKMVHSIRLLILLVLVHQITSDSCTAVPISLSSLNFCENNECQFSSLVNVAIPNVAGSSACLDFISPDGNTAKSLTITVLHTHVTYNLDYHYFTDDPVIDTRGSCHCPQIIDFGHPTSCNSLQYNNRDNICFSNDHADGGCVANKFGGHSRYNLMVGLGGLQRFKVYKFLPTAFRETLLSVNDGNKTWPITYTGDIVNFDDTSVQYNVTIISSTTVIPPRPDFVVIDQNKPSDFYLLDSSDVNGLDEFSYDKIGWYKTSEPVRYTPAIRNQFVTKVKNCANDRFQITHKLANTAHILTNRRTRASTSAAPTAVLIDPELSIPIDSKVIPEHHINPYTTLEKGWILYGASGPTFIGITKEQNLIPTPYMGPCGPENCGYNITIRTVCGVITSMNWKRSLVPMYTIDQGYQLLGLYRDENTGCYGICLGENIGTGALCRNVTFKAAEWPSLRVNTFFFDDQFSKHTNFNNKTANLGATLEIENFNGVLNLNVQFKNLTVSFEDTSPKVKIISTTVKENVLTMVAQSVTVRGSCFAYSEPAIILAAQPIDLLLSPTTYTLTMAPTVYNGTVTFGIRCYKNHVTVQKTVVFDHTPEQDGNSTVDLGSGDDDGGNTHHKKKKKDHYNDWYDWVFNTHWFSSGAKYWEYLLASGWLLVYVIIVVAIIVVLLMFSNARRYLMKPLKWIWNTFMWRKPTEDNVWKLNIKKTN